MWSVGADLTFDQETENRDQRPNKVVNTFSVEGTVTYYLTERWSLTTGL